MKESSRFSLLESFWLLTVSFLAITLSDFPFLRYSILVDCMLLGTYSFFLLSNLLVYNFSEYSHSHLYICVVSVMEKAMAPHSSALAWKIPWTEEPGGLQSMGSLRFGHDWANSLSLFTFIHWRRKWQPTPVFLPGESQGRGSLVGCHLWGHIESDTTEVT